MNFKLSVIASAVALLVSHSVSAQTLNQAVEQTIKTNPDILVDANRRLANDKTIDEARGGYFPKVDLNLGYGRENSDNITTRPGDRTLTRGEAGLTLSQMLYDGFGTRSEVARRTATAESSAWRVQGTSEQISLRAIETYLDVLRRQEQLILIQDNLHAHEKTFEQIKLRADSGVGRKADLEQIQARQALSQANVSSAEANLRESIINFRRVVGEPPVDLVKPEAAVTLPATADEAVEAGLANHPILNSAKSDIDATIAQTHAAQAALQPRVDLELGADWNNHLDGVKWKDNDAYAMLRLRYNLFRGGSDIARVTETKIQTLEAIEVSNRTRRQVEESTRLSWNALQTAIDRLPKLKEQADATERTRDAYYKQFNIGQRTLLDVLDSENELYTAKSNYVDAQYIELFAHYRLAADMGKLLESLGVAPRDEAKVASDNK